MMVKVIEQKQPIDPFIDMSPRQLANILFVGMGVGLVTWLLRLVVEKFILGPIFCHDSGEMVCNSVDGYANVMAMLFATAGGLVALVRLRIYRPLLVALAALVALWGLHGITKGMLWTASLSLFVVLNAASYGLFAWLARIRSFMLAVVAIIVAVALIRLSLG